jgi:PAS domain S-box-containing protein
MHSVQSALGGEASEKTIAHAILSTVGDGFLSLDRNWCFEYLSPGAEMLSGRKASEMLGKCLWKEFPEIIGTLVEDSYHTAVKTGQSVTFDYYWPVQKQWFAVRAYPSKEGGLYVAFSDVTRERLFEENSRQLAAIVESSDDAIISKDLNGTIRSWNRGAERIFGYTPEEAIGQPVTMMIPPDRLNEEPMILDRLRRGERVAHFESVRQRKDGSLVEVSLSISPIKDRKGIVIGASKVARDISFRNAAADAGRRLAAIVESSDDAIISKDLNGIIRSWNRGAERIFGYTPEEAIGKPITLLIPKNVHNEEPAILERLRRGERVDHYETVRQRKDGTLVDVSLTVSPLADSTGRVMGASKIARDISERRITEAALRREHEALAELDRRKNEFLAMMGHELRNPLAALQNAAELLVHGTDHDVSQWAAGVVYRQTRQLARLVNDLVDVARIMRGHFELHRAKAEVAQLVNAAVETARPLIDERKHSVDLSFLPEPVWVRVDSARIEQLLVNVLGNAAKYTDPGGVISVHVSLDGTDASVRITDNGIGIPPNLLPHIFDLFVQEAPGLDRSGGGLGIGLAVARRLAEMHDGTLSAHSEGRGKGSSFVLRLPLFSAMDGAKGDAAAPPQGRKDRPGNRRVLLVDDNVDSAQALARLLQRRGHEVHVAHDGIEALDLARKSSPDVFLLDLGLPHMDGYELIGRLQASRGSEVLYVAISGFALPDDLERSKAAGFHHHLPKPVEIEPLLELLETDKSRLV